MPTFGYLVAIKVSEGEEPISPETIEASIDGLFPEVEIVEATLMGEIDEFPPPRPDEDSL